MIKFIVLISLIFVAFFIFSKIVKKCRPKNKIHLAELSPKEDATERKISFIFKIFRAIYTVLALIIFIRFASIVDYIIEDAIDSENYTVLVVITATTCGLVFLVKWLLRGQNK